MSGATKFELTFELAAIDEDLEDALFDQLDAQCSTIAGVHLVSLIANASTCREAAVLAISAMNALGARVLRLVEDLVGRSEIARRAKVTPQAVGNWLRGQRQVESGAPPPYVVAGGVELWLWGEVRDWLANFNQRLDADVLFPSRSDHQMINGLLAVPAGWSSFESVLGIRSHMRSGSSAAPSSEQHVVAASSQHAEFALAA